MTREYIIQLIKNSIKILQKEKVFPDFDPAPFLKGAEFVECSAKGRGPRGTLRPEEKSHGDYSTNIAMQITRVTKKEPREIAETIKEKLKAKSKKLFEKIEIAGPGFINFFLSKDYLQKELGEILKQKESFGKLRIGKGKKINVEAISANPTGPLHIGNGRNAFSGDAISNILEKAGYKVTREYFINDAKVNTQIKLLGKTALGKGTIYLSPYLESKISKLKTKLKKITDEGEAGFLLAQEIQKDIKDFIEKKLKIKFDVWISENDFYKNKKIKKIFDWLKRKNLVYEKDKAWWVKTSEFGDERDWVVIRETGEPTYLLSDIAYHKDKIERGFQKIINIWGADHQAHVSKIKAAAKMLGFGGDLDILILQLVTLGGKEKLSKRRGTIITLEDLVNEIGLDVARFLYLQKSLDTHMEIDLGLAKEQSEKNPVYYIQYAHARIHSILAKSKIKNQKSKMPTVHTQQIKNQKLGLLKHPSELNLIKELIRFPEIIEDTARDYQVQRLPQYAMDLATVFHQFYRDCKVLPAPHRTEGSGAGSENKELTQARLALVLATKTVLKNTLDLMGISAPEKM